MANVTGNFNPSTPVCGPECQKYMEEQYEKRKRDDSAYGHGTLTRSQTSTIGGIVGATAGTYWGTAGGIAAGEAINPIGGGVPGGILGGAAGGAAGGGLGAWFGGTDLGNYFINNGLGFGPDTSRLPGLK